MSVRPGQNENTFWRLAYNIEQTGVRAAAKCYYEEYQRFNPFSLLQGKPSDGRFPPDFRFWVEAGPEPLGDHLATAVGWPIFSDRLLRHLWPLIEDCVQTFPAPIFVEGSGERLSSHHLVNVIR